jgi:4-hydroxybenzoate polyprenyltransferase
MRRLAGKILVFCEAIKVSHTVFALPFAVAAAFIAASGAPEWRLLGKIVLAVVLARTAAMAFNRWADASLDAANPRTARRALPLGILSRQSVLLASLACSAAFVLVAGWINALALALSPVALALLLGYSYSKRFTSLSHLILGAALGLSPVGAWVAVRGEIAVLPLLLGAAVLFWTAGFDVIYACQDHAFDALSGLHSLPRRLGVRRALLLSRLFHAITIALLAAVGWIAALGWVYAAGVGIVLALLIYEHSLVSAEDLSRVDLAFFTLNGLVSLAFMAAVVVQTAL